MNHAWQPKLRTSFYFYCFIRSCSIYKVWQFCELLQGSLTVFQILFATDLCSLWFLLQFVLAKILLWSTFCLLQWFLPLPPVARILDPWDRSANTARACQLNVTTVISPIDPVNLVWMAVQKDSFCHRGFFFLGSVHLLDFIIWAGHSMTSTIYTRSLGANSCTSPWSND